MIYWYVTFNECPKTFYGFINSYTLMKIGDPRRKKSVQVLLFNLPAVNIFVLVFTPWNAVITI